MDRRAASAFGVPGFALMQRAADALWREALRRWPGARRMSVFCGPGNNGGDGFLLALRARAAGREVRVFAAPGPGRGDARQARRAWLDAGGGVDPLPAAAPLLAADLHVDALFGSGLNRALAGAPARVVELLNASAAPVLAIDVPSGLDADTGACPGPAVHAAATLCLVAWKRGLFTRAARDHCGALALAPLDLPEALHAGASADAHLLAPAQLAPRRRDSHKGRFGHLLVLGGDTGFGGAVRLAGEAALRCGAGRVSVITRPEHVGALLAARPELMVRGSAAGRIPEALLRGADVLAVGPGLGRDAWGSALLAPALAAAQPLVLDADALNLLAAGPMRFAGRAVVLTPHPGEAARLLGTDVATVQADRFAAARALADQFAAVIVLKGAGTIIARPEGAAAVCPWGNPAMATAGMGDVLTGVIAALLAQGLDAWTAACIGTGWHARAGDAAAAGAERGLLAGDLFAPLRALAGDAA